MDGGLKRNTKAQLNVEERYAKLTLIFAAIVTIRQDSLMDERNVPDEGKSGSMSREPLCISCICKTVTVQND
jgi:hypothetical protein